MTVTDDDLRAGWQQRSSDEHGDRRGCLADDDWVRLLSKDATKTERTRAADHVGGCADCAAEYRLKLSILGAWR